MCHNTLCSFCGIAKEALKKDGQFEEHFQEHLGDQYHCGQCNKTFTSNHKLVEHTRHMHKGQHTCEMQSNCLQTAFALLDETVVL